MSTDQAMQGTSASQHAPAPPPETPEQAFNRMLAQSEQLAARLNTAEEIIGTLSNQLEQRSLPAQPKAKEIKIAMPMEFSGKPDEAKDFLLAVKNYIIINREVYAENDKQAGFIFALCKRGLPAKWASGFIKKFIENGKHDDTEEIFKSFERTFITTKETDVAMNQIRSLKQMGSVASYLNQIDVLFQKANITEDNSKIILLQNGLKIDLVKEMCRIKPRPTTYKEWREAAIMVESDEYTFKGITASHHSSRHTHTPRNTPIIHFDSGPVAKGPEPMDVDRITLSYAEKKKLMDEGRCFECKEIGHRASAHRSNRRPNTFAPRPKTTVIRSIITNATAEEKEAIRKDLEAQGF